MPNVRYALCVKKEVVHFKQPLCAGVVQQVPHMSHAFKGQIDQINLLTLFDFAQSILYDCHEIQSLHRDCIKAELSQATR